MIKPIFIFSLHRSGSTYLKNIIDQDDEVKMLEDEIHFDHPFFFNTYKKLFKKHYKRDLEKFLQILEKKKIRGAFWKLYKEKFQSFRNILKFVNETVDEWSVFNAVLNHVLAESGKKRIGIKYPAHFSVFEQFQRQYREAKYLFLVRDPRAIVASKITSPSNIRIKNRHGIRYELIRLLTVFYFALEFRFYIKKLRKHEKNIFPIQYEKLVIEPVKTIQEICEFCEISFSEKMCMAEGKNSGYQMARNKQERLTRWKKVLRRHEHFCINIITGKTRKYFSYNG